MDRAPAPRAVVFALEDLPAADRQYILSLATHLRLQVRPESWRAPLLLTADSTQPGATPSIAQTAPLPGLLSDAELSAAGPSLMLLSLRLLLADAYHWPELRWLGIPENQDHASHVLYVADPGRWTVDALSRELSERGFDQIQRGLCPHSQRPPASPGDRVPMLGWQVPMLGSKDPVAELRDLRPPEQRQHRFAGVNVPLGMVPGNLTDRHRLFFQVKDARRDGDHGKALIDLLCVDGALGEGLTAQIEVTLDRLSATGSLGGSSAESLGEGSGEIATDLAGANIVDSGRNESDALAELLREILPGCLLLTPRGELLVLDLYRLGLHARPISTACLAGLRMCAAPPRPDAAHGPSQPYEDEGQQLLDPAHWDVASLSGVLHPDDLRLSHGGRFVSLRFFGSRDGLPVDAVVLLDTIAGGATGGTTSRAGAPDEPAAALLCWPVLLDGPAPALALSPDERIVALFAHQGQAAFAVHDETLPPLSPACISPDMDSPAVDWIDAHANDLLFFTLPGNKRGEDSGAGLLPQSSASLPNAMSKPGPLSLSFLPDSSAVICHQPVGNLLCTIELPLLSAIQSSDSDLLKAPIADSDRHRFPPRARLRATTAADLLALLTADGGQPLRRLLRTIGTMPSADAQQPGSGDDIPGLSFFSLASTTWHARQPETPAVGAAGLASLLRAPLQQAAAAVLVHYLATRPRTFTTVAGAPTSIK